MIWTKVKWHVFYGPRCTVLSSTPASDLYDAAVLYASAKELLVLSVILLLLQFSRVL